MSESREKTEKIFAGAAFTFFVLITCYKLTNSSLWFDETIEYWYSKVMFGPLPYEGAADNSLNMYQRIISTYQPPLYNFIMFFWLKISDSEWWFRFFGVVIGFIGMVGIYKTIKKISGNSFLSSCAVIFSSCIYQLVYFWQECAEYCLVLGSLCWTMYFWVCLIQNINRKNMILFTISAIIPIYSQYGAAFPVLPMCLIAYLIVLSKRNKKNIIEISAAYLGALICAALPLYVFFLKIQILNQQARSITPTPQSIGFIKEWLISLLTVFEWNFASHYSDVFVRISLIILLLGALSVLIWGKTLPKLVVALNAIIWVFYYISVRLALYAYGVFGNRYNLFFIPLWIVLIFTIGNEIYCILQQTDLLKRLNVQTFFLGSSICLMICYCLLNWNVCLQYNWSKEDIRGPVNAWYQQSASEKNTLVYYGAGSGFSYYVRLSEQYDDETENNVIYMSWYRNESVEEYINYIDSVYEGNWPPEVYLVGSHIRDDFNTIIAAFTESGYISEDIYDSGGGRLIKLICIQTN